MRQTLSKGMVVAAAAATGVLSLYGSAAFAGSQAQGTAQGSPGVLSGNSIQAPVNVPVNICGDSVDAAAALNPAFGNSCGNVHRSHVRPGDNGDDSGYGDSGDDDTPTPPYGGDETTPPSESSSSAYGGEETTPPSESSSSAYGGEETTPPSESTPPAYGGEETTPPSGGHSATPPTLAHTGGDGPAMLATSAASAALVAAGAILYRRGRVASRR